MLERALLAAVFGSVALCGPAGAAELTTTTPVDEFGVEATCSLREAVESANTDTSFGGCASGSGPDTITLGPGEYELARGDLDPNTESPGTDDLNIADDLTIRGAGADRTTIQVRVNDRAIAIGPSSFPDQLDVTIRDLRISGGRAPSGQEAGSHGESGGAILALNARLSLAGCRITDNRAGNGADGDVTNRNGGSGGSGGAVAAFVSHELTVERCRIDGNHSGAGGDGSAAGGSGGPGGGGLGGDGGGIAAGIPSSMVVRRSTFDGNSTGPGGDGGDANPAAATAPDATGGTGRSGGNGGAISTNGSFPGEISDSTFTTNSTGDGGRGGAPATAAGTGGFGASGGSGGAIQFIGQLDLTRARIASNAAGDGGTGGPGGADNPTSVGGTGGGGGGFAGATGTLTVRDSTISGNSAGNGADAVPRARAGTGALGGGLVIGNTDAVVERSTISGNAAGDGGNGLSSVAGGEGGPGGGIARSNGPMSLLNTTVSGNRSGDGGAHPSTPGAPGAAAGVGAGIYKRGVDDVIARHATVANNTPGQNGPNIGTTPGPGTPGYAGAVALVALNFQAAPRATFTSSILANNGQFACQGAVTARGADTIAYDALNPSCPGRDANPKLGALAGNGGATFTHSLPADSPPLNIAAAAGCPATDQRGVKRPQGGRCDAGAYERVVTAPKPPLPPPPPPPVRDTTAPSIMFALRRQGLRRVLARGYRANFQSGELGTARVDLLVGRKRIGRKSKRLTRVGANSVVVKFSRKVRKRYSKRRRLRVTVRLTVTDLAGNRAAKVKRLTLKR